MKANAVSLAALSAAFRSYRASLRGGALVLASLSTVRTVEAIDSRNADRLAVQIVREHSTDDNTADGDDSATLASAARITGEAEETRPGAVLGAYLLSPAERAAIRAARPGARSLVLRAAPAPAAEDEPLPPDFVPAPVPDYSPLLIAISPEETAQIAAEAAAEFAERERIDARDAAAVSFVSDYAEHGPDFAPVVPRVVRPVASVANAAPMSDAESLRAAVLATAKPRRVTVRV